MVGWFIWPRKVVPKMTYNVSSGMVNPTMPIHIDDVQHKGTMYTKPVFEKITKIVCPVMWTYNICALTPARTMTVIDKVTIFCNDVNERTRASIELLAINILCYLVIKK